jgi:hippurate hydrolase
MHRLEEHKTTLSARNECKNASMTYNEYVEEAARYSDILSGIRRELHQMPEFGLDNPRSTERCLASCEGLGEVFRSKRTSGAALLIRGDQPGPTVLLRTDTDALAVIEDTGLEFASTNGYMHACGHDLHMAMAVGAAHLLHTHRNRLKGNVVIWFQPGEEGHGGADVMLEEGLHLVSGELPIAAYGIHVFSSYPLGIFGSRPGPLMASAGGMTVTFKGQGGHGSMPWLSRDPIAPMAEVMQALQTTVAKKISAFEPVVINIGWVKAGDDHTENVIPEVAQFGATIRTFSDTITEQVRAAVRELLAGVAAAHGVSAEVEFHPFTKVLMNDPKAIDRVERIVDSSFGRLPNGASRYVDLEHPITGGEDFASVLKEMPGAFVFMGACPPDRDHSKAETNHSNKAVFDDSKLSDGSALLAALAFDTLDEAAAN